MTVETWSRNWLVPIDEVVDWVRKTRRMPESESGPYYIAQKASAFDKSQARHELGATVTQDSSKSSTGVC